MKNWLLLLALVLVAALPQSAWANRAAPFRGIYDILSQRDMADPAPPAPIFLLDADTLGVIWSRYADGPLPADLEHLRNEPTIIAGFNNRSTLFFGLERGALILEGYLAMDNGDGDRLELQRRGDGQYDMAVKEKGRVTVYHLAAPRPIGQALKSQRKPLLPHLVID